MVVTNKLISKPKNIPNKPIHAEQLIQNQVRVALSKAGHKVFRANVGKVHTSDGRFFDTGLPSGFPDLFGFRKTDGKAFFIEMKNERGRLRDDQKIFGKMLSQQPVLYGVARSVEDTFKILEDI